MKTLSESRLSRFVILIALYTAQGITYGYVAYALSAYLIDNGATQGQVANILALSTLPWSFKWIWGLLIDRFSYPAMGRRRPWILVAQFLKAITIFLMIFSSDKMSSLKYMMIMIFLHNVCSSLQDVSADALAVDILHEKERGKANGLMKGASYLGTAIGIAGAGWVLRTYGFRESLIFQAVILFGIGLFPLFMLERPGEKLLPWTKGKANLEKGTKAISSTVELLLDLKKAFSIRTTVMAVGLTVWVNIAYGMITVVAVAMVVKSYGWTQEEWQKLWGIPVQVAACAACLLGGYISDFISPRKSIVFSIAILGTSWILFSFCQPLWPNKIFIYWFIIWEQFLIAFFTVSVIALCMSVTWSAVAGTQFTGYMAMLNLSMTLGAKLAGWLEGVSYPMVYAIAGIVQLISILFVFFISPKQAKEVFGTVGEQPEESL